ncbi:MAG TPA: ATP-binding protein, partial [Chloroflexota bacterium]|nr:ATP-binding protein [Chloroflexota bacterium]
TAALLLNAPVAGVYLLDAAGEYFDLVAGEGFDMAEGTDLRLPREQSAAGQVIASREPEAIPDVSVAGMTALPRIVSGEAVGALVVAPIISRSGPLGVIEVYSRTTGVFGNRDAHLLFSLAAAAAAALENARLYREREEDLVRLHTIVEQLPVGIVVAEAQSGHVSLKNVLSDELLGVDVNQLRVGVSDPRRGFHTDGKPYEVDGWPLARALEKGEVSTNERITIARPDGGTSHLSVNAAPILDGSGQIIAAVAVFDDVSGEEELQRQKEQFLAAAAHDLKTPLTSIRGLAQLLEMQIGRFDPTNAERIKGTLEGIASGTRKMTSLIEELLDLTRIEAMGNLSLNQSQTDMVALARSVIETHKPNAPQHRIELVTTADHITGNWDEARLERALSNLVGNAIKYSPEGGEVTVRVGTDQSNGTEEVVVSVKDGGIGIPAGEVGRIFERFQRGSNVPQGLSGSGVGLPYVRQIVVEHGGAIVVDSKPGEGSVFTIRLPREGA